MSVDLSWEYSEGRINGTFAPYYSEIFLISSESVETTTWSNIFDSIAETIEYAISGWPFKGVIFLLTTLFDPDLAGIRATLFFMCNYHAVHPPSETILLPVIYEEASLNKKWITPLYSCFSAILPRGTFSE